MGFNLTPISVGDGDPVTADTIRKIVENINIIAKGQTVTPIAISNTTINGGSVTVGKGLNTTVGGILTKKTLKSGSSWTVNLSGYGFTDTPVIQLTLEILNKTDNGEYSVHILNPSKTGFSIYVRTTGGSPKTYAANIHWAAHGNVVNTTEA